MIENHEEKKVVIRTLEDLQRHGSLSIDETWRVTLQKPVDPKIIQKIRRDFKDQCGWIDEEIVMREAIQLARAYEIPLSDIWIWKCPVPPGEDVDKAYREMRKNYYEERKKGVEAEVRFLWGELDSEFPDVVDALPVKKIIPQTGDIPAVVQIQRHDYIICPGCLEEKGSLVGTRWERDLTKTITCSCGWKIVGEYPQKSKTPEDEDIKNRILDLLDEKPDGMSLRAISKGVELSREKANRLVNEMIEGEVLYRDESGKLLIC